MRTIVLILLVLSGCVMLAHAAPVVVPDPANDFGGFLQVLVGFFGRNWLFFGAVCVTGLVALVRWQRVRLVEWIPALGSQMGGWVLNFALSALAQGAVGVLAAKPFVDVFLAALTAGFAAAGMVQAKRDGVG